MEHESVESTQQNGDELLSLHIMILMKTGELFEVTLEPEISPLY
jgi:hypothetical protein